MPERLLAVAGKDRKRCQRLRAPGAKAAAGSRNGSGERAARPGNHTLSHAKAIPECRFSGAGRDPYPEIGSHPPQSTQGIPAGFIDLEFDFETEAGQKSA